MTQKSLFLLTILLLMTGICCCTVHMTTAASSSTTETNTNEQTKTPHNKSNIPNTSNDTNAEDDENACTLPKDAIVHSPVLGMPQILGSRGKPSVERSEATVELNANGSATVQFTLYLKNNSRFNNNIFVGQAWQLSNQKADSPLTIDGEKIPVCKSQNPANPKNPIHGYFKAITIKGGKEAKVTGTYSVKLKQHSHRAALMGYLDKNNAKWTKENWAYIHARHYKKYANKIKPYWGEFLTARKSKNTRIAVKSKNGQIWMRSMSHDPNILFPRSPGTYAWQFNGQNLPSKVSFEYSPDYPIDDEKTLFEKLVSSRKHDLHAQIQLSDLYLFLKDKNKRVTQLKTVLNSWNTNAQKEKLHDQTSIHSAVYAALVNTLLGQKKQNEAQQYAAEGIAVIKQMAKPTESDLLVKKWLENQFPK